MMKKYELITILGPTASGKTGFACQLANKLGTEIISGDSRQVYRMMDLGTGKDLADYNHQGKQIPYHLIDIRDTGYKYNIYEYQHDFHTVFARLRERGLMPILCGGSGLYIESVLKGYSLVNVPENKELREKYKGYTLTRLSEILRAYKTLHNKTDIDTAQRAIRAIEIEEYKKTHLAERKEYPPIESLNIGISIDREERRQRITQRLKARLDEGMLDEVKSLLDSGITPEELIYYGLEYKYLTLHLQGKLTYAEMYSQLEIAIHQFAKRQMTWFRGMEKRGLEIHWIDYKMSDEEKAGKVIGQLLR